MLLGSFAVERRPLSGL